jgi:hypothetical protein
MDIYGQSGGRRLIIRPGPDHRNRDGSRVVRGRRTGGTHGEHRNRHPQHHRESELQTAALAGFLRPTDPQHLQPSTSTKIVFIGDVKLSGAPVRRCT